MEPRFGPDRNGDGITDFHWNEAPFGHVGSYDQSYVNPEGSDGSGPLGSGFKVNFNGCPDRMEYEASGPPEFEAQNQYTWDFGDGSPAVTANNCLPSHTYNGQGSYEVKLTVVPRTGTTQPYTQTIEVRDILIAALGDSYGSGEGAPDVPLRTRFGWGDPTKEQPPVLGTWKEWPGGDARWVDERCHRSAYSGSAQAARRLEYSDPHTSVTYISFACSGANISRETYEPNKDWLTTKRSHDDLDKFRGSGLLGPYRGIEPPNPESEDSYKPEFFLPPQVDALARTLADCDPAAWPDYTPCPEDHTGRPIDALIISAGGNGALFAKVLAVCTTGAPWFLQPSEYRFGGIGPVGTDCFDDPELTGDLDQRMEELPGRYNDLVKAIHDRSTRPARPPLEFSQRTPDVPDVYLTEYPDSMTDDNGNNCDSILGDVTGFNFPGKINSQEVNWLRESFVAPLLVKMQEAVYRANTQPDLRPNGNDDPDWKYVEGIGNEFAHHGYCADDRYVNTGEDARWLQGPATHHVPMTLSAMNLIINPLIAPAVFLVNYEVGVFSGRASTEGKAHPNRKGYGAYADILVEEHLNPLIGLPAGDQLPKFEARLTTADGTSTQGANGWLTGSDASLGRAVLGVSVDDPSEIAAAAATINDNTSCPTNTASAAECSFDDVSAQRKEWRFRFHEDGIYRLEFTAQGGDGQTATYAHDVSVDLHDPEAFAEPSRPPDTNGWYTAPVDVMLGGEDPGGGSGVQKMEYILNDGPVQELVPGEKVTVDAKGTTTLRYQSVDGAGRKSSMREISINIDGTPPVIEVPADITEYATGSEGAQVNYSATATDNVDGDVPVDCSPESGSTFPIGATQVNCSATDTAGNESTKTFNVSVLYDFGNGSGGSYTEPVTNGALNEVKAGSGVPVKFALGGNMGLDIFATGYPTSRKISCDTQAVTDPIEETVAVTSSGVKFDTTAGQYIYNFKTDKAWASTCTELVVKFKDGTEHPISFKFKYK